MTYNKAAMDRYRATEKGRDNHRRNAKTFRTKAKEDVMAAYGTVCQCCAESTMIFLTIDHIGGGGGKMRAETPSYSTTKFYSELRRLGYPAGYRVLCLNCNFAEGHGGCPHQNQGGI